MKIATVFWGCVIGLGSFASVAPDSTITKEDPETWLVQVNKLFSGENPSEVMFHRPEKYSVVEGKLIEPNSLLKIPASNATESRIAQLAQRKLDAVFHAVQCDWLKKKFPKINCDVARQKNVWEGVEYLDQIEMLTETWMPVVEKMIDKLPSEGKTDIALWSDDYWKLRWGGISYRYGEGSYFSDYIEAINSYFQPEVWITSLQSLSVSKLNYQIEKWSPAEKYDLITNNLQFGLTQEQKHEGRQFMDERGDIEGWMGLCHGWAAASIMAPKADKSISVWGPSGTEVKWFPHDVRALTTLAWANGDYRANFVGQRCNRKSPSTYSNGRIKDDDCFDNNPATFHLALANLIGIAKASFIMDAAFDYQVWNQPVAAYEFNYFNPINPEKTSKNWEEVSVPYDHSFKSKDPFQKPLTRGHRMGHSDSYDDSRVEKIVGVKATVTYLGEVYPSHGDLASGESYIRVTYTYDLELGATSGAYKVIGGEWYTNAHPDFLWVPEKNSLANFSFDLTNLEFSGLEVPSAQLSNQAERASRYGYPLCSVISFLLKGAAPGSSYGCP